ncbi:methyltransferase domain-containing protein [Nocardia concava]|uniref:methyltransferase domain-containing protein n=1 Tax=Nocardia concava TaxID=257281 RepID=UPI0002FB3E97|nr:methyltransferase domain-containing protein [Nocardia concava]
MSGEPLYGCRGCGLGPLVRVLDLGKMPAADDFPSLESAGGPGDSAHPLAMDLCAMCGLAQLAEDDTVTAEPRGVEPRALREQAADAVSRVAAGGWLPGGGTVREFGSPHGGTWLPLLTERGYTVIDRPADVVIDCFGIMHEPHQRVAFAQRAAATAPGGVLLLQFHSLHAIVRQGQWNALRHGHFAYYSLAALQQLLRSAGLVAVTAWEFELYGGTVLVAAVHAPAEADPSLARIRTAEAAVADPAVVRGLQQAADRQARALRGWLEDQSASGRVVYAYGAASRAVALLHLAGAHRGLLAGVADASPGKQGRRMPGTDIPILSPAELVAAQPDLVFLTLPDLLPEVSGRWPELNGKWVTEVPETL